MQRSKRINIIAIAAIFFVLVVIIGIVWYRNGQKSPQPLEDTISEDIQFPFYRSLDGAGVFTESESTRRPIGVMIDNAADALPNVGVEHAPLVYETIAEGSITRLLAIFDPESLPDEIGAVRSLRPYYLSWANEVDAIMVHVGGSPEALEAVASQDHMDEFSSGRFFWRVEDRSAPHDVFTSAELLQSAIDEYGFATSTNFPSWTYVTSTSVFSESASEVTINFSIDLYKVTWVFDQERHEYLRKRNGVTEPVSAKNIIIQVMPVRVLDSALRRELSVTGRGRAWVIRDGRVTLGYWIRASEEERTQYVDEAGSPIPLLRGTTWVEVIDDEGRVSFD